MIPKKRPSTGSVRIDLPADKLLPVLNQKVVTDAAAMTWKAAKATGNTSLVAMILPCGTFDILMQSGHHAGVMTYSNGSDVATASACISFLESRADSMPDRKHFDEAVKWLREFVRVKVKEARSS